MLERSGIVKQNVQVLQGIEYHHPRRPPWFPVKPRSLERKVVTIGVGFFCNDGIVLCADTQHTIPGYTKEFKGKIITVITRDWAIAFAYAGSDDYIRTAIEQAQGGLNNCKGLNEIAARLKSNLLRFFSKHLKPWAAYPQAERPTVELLIGVATKHAHGLFHYSGTSFYNADQKAIGAGVIVANNLIADYCFGNHTLEELSGLGIYVLSRVKKQVESCSGDTYLVALKNGPDIGFCDLVDTRKLETELEAIESNTIAELKKTVVAKGPPNISWLRAANTDKLAKELRRQLSK